MVSGAVTPLPKRQAEDDHVLRHVSDGIGPTEIGLKATIERRQKKMEA